MGVKGIGPKSKGVESPGLGKRGRALVALCGLLAAACGESSAPSSPGNDVVNDTRDAQTRPPANPDPGDGSIPMGQPDGSYGGETSVSEGGIYSDAPTAPYPGVTACSSCSCDPASDYCFGGATKRGPDPQLAPEGTTDAAGAADAACPVVPAGTIGCTPLVSGCTDCTCLVQTLQPSYACYLVCANDGTQMTVYCPSP